MLAAAAALAAVAAVETTPHNKAESELPFWATQVAQESILTPNMAVAAAVARLLSETPGQVRQVEPEAQGRQMITRDRVLPVAAAAAVVRKAPAPVLAALVVVELGELAPQVEQLEPLIQVAAAAVAAELRQQVETAVQESSLSEFAPRNNI